ncbi:MAG: hypothetical protein HC902_12605 [Calothrix sp. SM1_5_4]|nr:hypothetical protein [Calothrix sp. SM1_5_4]
MKGFFQHKRMAVTLFLLCAVQWLAQYDFDIMEGSFDLASRAGKNKGRSTELGKPVPTKSKPEKEDGSPAQRPRDFRRLGT